MKSTNLFCLLAGLVTATTIAIAQEHAASESGVRNNSLSDIYNPNAWRSNIVWGKATNNLCFGVHVLNAAEARTGNDLFFYLLNVGTTNMKSVWMAPPGFQRFQLELYDSAGTSIPLRSTESVQTYRNYKTLAEVPKNKRGVSIGWIATAPNLPRSYGEMSLTNTFKMERKGEYTLIVTGCIMRVNHPDGSLTAVTLPPVSVKFRTEVSDN